MTIKEEQKFRDYLKQKGLKFTPERHHILEEAFSLHKHFDVEELVQKIHEKHERISPATVYRTLPLLIDSHLIQKTFKCRDRVSYEHIFGRKHHDHMICLGCGKIIEFRDEKIEKLQGAVCKKFGFKAVEHRLGIRGYCKECQKKLKGA